jgi:hypothetical protein
VPDRLATAIALIDEANADDPHTIVVDGVERPKEQTHAEMMTAWVTKLDPAADDAQLLAARAHHLRRWVVPRSSYPEGRSGYLRWRADAKVRHAEEVAALLERAGYDQATVERVQAIVRKERLARDHAVKVHEDALCLVFFETQAVAVGADLGEEKAIDVVRKTLRKMSPEGRQAASALALPDGVHELVARAGGW